MCSIIRSTGTVFYSLLYLNSGQGFSGLIYMYSVISVECIRICVHVFVRVCVCVCLTMCSHMCVCERESVCACVLARVCACSCVTEGVTVCV